MAQVKFIQLVYLSTIQGTVVKWKGEKRKW